MFSDSFSSSASFITLKNSLVLLLFINFSLNSLFINSVLNVLNTSKCRLLLPSGAAIKNINLTSSPSKESKFTPFGTTAATSFAVFTLFPFPCGIAIPSPTPVVPSFSLLKTNSAYSSLLFKFPVSFIKFITLFNASSFEEASKLSIIELSSNKSVIFITYLLINFLSFHKIFVFLIFQLKILNKQLHFHRQLLILIFLHSFYLE